VFDQAISLLVQRHSVTRNWTALNNSYVTYTEQFHNKSSTVAEMGDRLATIDMGRKVGAAVLLFVGELGPHLTQCSLGRGLPLYQVASWSIQPFGHNRHGSKIGGCASFGTGARSPSNTMWPGPRPPSIPSGILIHPTVWPQYINVTNNRQRFNSYGEPFYKRSPKNLLNVTKSTDVICGLVSREKTARPHRSTAGYTWKAEKSSHFLCAAFYTTSWAVTRKCMIL